MANTKSKATMGKARKAKPERIERPPLDPAKVQLAAMRELMRIVTSEPSVEFKLPAIYRDVFMGEPEYGFAKILMTGGYGFDGLCALANESPSAIYAHIVRLAAGATSPAWDGDGKAKEA